MKFYSYEVVKFHEEHLHFISYFYETFITLSVVNEVMEYSLQDLVLIKALQTLLILTRGAYLQNSVKKRRDVENTLIDSDKQQTIDNFVNVVFFSFSTLFLEPRFVIRKLEFSSGPERCRTTRIQIALSLLNFQCVQNERANQRTSFVAKTFRTA